MPRSVQWANRVDLFAPWPFVTEPAHNERVPTCREKEWEKAVGLAAFALSQLCGESSRYRRACAPFLWRLEFKNCAYKYCNKTKLTQRVFLTKVF